jgi:hypothetical protein
MMTYDFAALERRFYGTPVSVSALTPKILGKIIVAAWRGEHDPAPDALLSHRRLERLIIDNFSTSPAAVRDILHFDRRPYGVRIEEMTRLIAGPTCARLLTRAYPPDRLSYIMVDLLHACLMFDHYTVDFPEVVAWAHSLARAAARGRSADTKGPAQTPAMRPA